MRRRGFKSMVQDEWAILDPKDREIGLVQEDSLPLALIRRFFMNLVPQSWNASVGGAPVAVYAQHFNPFILKITVDFTADVTRSLDRRLGIAIAVLLNAIEGRQQ
jgi:hypothetical protein